MNKYTKFLVLFLIFHFIESQTTDENSEVDLEFDESAIKSLKLTLKWGFKPRTNRRANKYILFYEVGRINYVNNYSVEYSAPELLDDEEVVRASVMKRENFKNRAEFMYLSSYNCSLYCINSTNLLTKNPFECNLYSYDPSIRKCVLYEYDYRNKNKNKKVKKRFDDYEIYDYFMDECDMDEFFSEFSGYSRLCRRMMDYRNEHAVLIRPFIDFRFSISLRDTNNKWTPFLRKEFQYSPSITVDIIGEMKFGKDVKLKCKTDMSKEIVESITWRNSPQVGDTFLINQLSPYSLHQTYYCEIRIGSRQMIQKAFKFNLTELEGLKSELKLSQTLNSQDLSVNLSWIVEPPTNTKFKSEKILLLYSENGQPYKFLKNFFPFQSSRWESANYPFNRENRFYNTSSEEECANLCIETSFCNHFVYKLQVEPYSNDRFQSNCRISSKAAEGFFQCPKFSSCQNLKNPDSYISNDSVKISILPNVTYRFKVQLKDKYLNWTDALETEPIFVPLSFSFEKIGSQSVTDSSIYSLKCTTNINRINKIIWTLNDVDISAKNGLYNQTESSDVKNLNSVLNFNLKSTSNISVFNGVYKCKIVRESDVSEFVVYNSQPIEVNLRLNDTLKYEQSKSNITLPTLPGLYIRLDCQVSGSPIDSLNWLVEGQILNQKNRIYDFEDMFVITSKINDNIPIVNRSLIIRLEDPKKLMKYECILNGNVTIRSHFIEIIDERPELDYKIDKTELNKLKLSIRLGVKNPIRMANYKDLDVKPLKLSILYAENSSINNALSTYVAPDTLSRKDDSQINPKNFQNSIGHLLKTQHGIQSCKLSCFQSAFCKSYEYFLYDDNCIFYSNDQLDPFYDTLIDKIKQKNPLMPFNLIHLRDDAPKTLEEELIYNYTILIDKKPYSSCENRTANSFNEEVFCRDELADFRDVYTFDNLIPATSYQFKIEISNAFGISVPITSEEIQVPFKLNPIVQHDIDDIDKLNKLECSTDLLINNKLKFSWYREKAPVDTKDSNFSQNDILDSNVFKSELIFHGDVKKFIGHYTCVLMFESETNRLSVNTSYMYMPKMSPEFMKLENVLLTKKLGDMFTENCSATGWPLPKVYWYYKNKPVEGKGQRENESPYASVHHRNYTAMSYLFGFNLSKEFEGVYTCMVNENIVIKNVTLVVLDNGDKVLPTDDPKVLPNKEDNKKTSNSFLAVLIALFVLIAIGGVLGSVFFIKKKRSDTSALLSYNRIEEELMTGVDNVNLTDDTQ